MRLADFIEASLEPIINEWVAFARTLNAAGTMDLEALRDHSSQILAATIADMREPQTENEREAKGKGQKPVGEGGSPLNDASEGHAANRLGWGFDVNDIASEYRALRATVLRLWARDRRDFSRSDVDDVTRFDESLDQSLAKTLRSYSHAVDQARETFLGILGHDLRQPLAAIDIHAQILARAVAASPTDSESLRAIRGAVAEMSGMIGDLLDFTRTRLGSGIPVNPVLTELSTLGRELTEQVGVVHAGCAFEFDVSGDTAGAWDVPRLRQAITNLLVNACRHGAAGGPIRLAIDGTDPAEVRVAVNNQGNPIPPADLRRIFDPMFRGKPGANAAAGPTGGVGLGLFVAREVARAHRGTLGVDSSASAGTTFTLRLPRRSGE